MMKRTQTLLINPGRLELDVFVDKINDVNFVFDELGIGHSLKHSNTPGLSFQGRYNTLCHTNHEPIAAKPLVHLQQVNMQSPTQNASRTALITGGSSGIGLALAKKFADHGYDLVLVARNLESLEKAGTKLNQDTAVKVTTIAKDLSQPNAPKEIYQELKQKNIAVDILVNNAGFGTEGAFVKTNLITELEMIQVNITALTHLTKLFLPDMLARGEGKILNVASTAGFQPGPFFAVYFATKAYVLSFTEALAEEVRGTGVIVTALCPGPTKTSFAERAETQGKGVFMRETRLLKADEVARIGYNALMKGKAVVVPGLTNKLMVFLLRLSPRRVVTKVVRYINTRG